MYLAFSVLKNTFINMNESKVFLIRRKFRIIRQMYLIALIYRVYNSSLAAECSGLQSYVHA